MNRVAVALIIIASVLPVYAQTPRPAQPPKPGVPAVQHPMARIVPDAEYAITGSPDWLAMGDDQVWTNSRSMDIVSRMDPNTHATVAVVPVKNPCSGLVVAAGTLWAPSCAEGVVYRIDTKTNMVVAKVPVSPAHNEGGIAYGAGSIWLPSDPKGIVTRIDPATNGVAATIPVAPGSFTVVFGYGRVWVSSTEKSVVSVIHPATNKVVAEIAVDTAPRFMAVGEGYVWTLNQGKGSVTKIDPVTMKVEATIEVGVPGGGGDIAAGEGAVWVTAREIPVSRIDAGTNQVTHQFVGPGGDAIRVLHGSVWLSNGRWSNVWRFQASKILNAFPSSWMTRAQKADLDADGKTDVLVEDLRAWFPGQPTLLRIKPLGAAEGSTFVLKTTLNGKTADVPFVKAGDHYEATFTGDAPRWIHYSVCVRLRQSSGEAGDSKCSPELVVASAATTPFVPPTFAAPGPPRIGNYVWNILEPTILSADHQALMDRADRTSPATITLAQDYGELKRHEWEFQHHTAFAYGILTPDRQSELACVYINPATKPGSDATVRIWVTRQAREAGLEPVLHKAVREWVTAKWPFKSVVFPEAR